MQRRTGTAGRAKPSSRGDDGIEWAETYTISPEEARALVKLEDGTECVPCPPNRVQGRYHNLKSTYSDSYRGDFEPAQRIARKIHALEPRPFLGTTTHQDDFKFMGMPKRREPSTLARTDNGISEKNLPFEGVTTNQHDFRKWNARPPKIMTKQHNRDNQPDERDFGTEFSQQFGHKVVAPRKSRAPQEKRPRPLPFTGTTTNRDNYKRWGVIEPAESVMPTRSYRPRADDRDFISEARGEYTEKPFDIRPPVGNKNGCPPGWCRREEVEPAMY